VAQMQREGHDVQSCRKRVSEVGFSLQVRFPGANYHASTTKNLHNRATSTAHLGGLKPQRI